MTMRSFLSAGLVALLPFAVLQGQVGHLPEKSPFRDLEHRQEFTWFAGQFQSGGDPAKVAPQSGPMVGIHYELHMTGPAYLTARIAQVFSERTVLDPNKLLAERDLGKKSVTMTLADVGFALNLTGYKSWHGVVPSLGGGLGIGAGYDKLDVGNYKVGFPFLLSLRPGLKLATRGRWQVRVDASNYFYRIRYPETYFTKITADPTILPPSGGRNVWKRNLGLTGGLTYAFGR